MKKLKIGIVGLGGIAHDAHIPAIKSNDKVEVVALCDIIPAKIDKVKSSFNAKTYTDYKEMINSENLDIVHICTPNYLHSQIAVYALNKGVNVFCEKPDSVSVDEVNLMKEAMIKSGKHLMVMRNNRHLTGSKELKSMILNGRFGDIYTGRCGWIRKRGIPGKGGWFTTKELSGGGPLIDLGVHMIDLAIYLMGNPRPISVSGSTYQKFANCDEKSDSIHSNYGDKVDGGTIDVEDLAIGFIKFDNGASLQIEFSWASNIKSEVNFVELRGTKLGASWKNGFYELYDGNALPNIFKRSAEKIRQAKSYSNGHKANINHFVEVVLGNEKPDFVIDQGVNMIKILEAIYTSAKTNKEVLL